MKKVIIEENGIVSIKQGDSFYKCKVRKVCDDGKFYVDKPLRGEEEIKLEFGDIVSLDYYTEFGTYYKLQIKVLGRILEDGIFLYIFSSPIKYTKIQRRDFVRAIAAEYAVYRAEEEYDWEKAILLDLSGGGLKLSVKEELKVGEKIKIKFQYNKYESSLNARVLRCNRDDNNGYMCGMEFIDLDERKRDKIVKKVFEIMRKQREIM